eukprot:4555358-Prymnesium_polylepis.1
MSRFALALMRAFRSVHCASAAMPAAERTHSAVAASHVRASPRPPAHLTRYIRTPALTRSPTILSRRAGPCSSSSSASSSASS